MPTQNRRPPQPSVRDLNREIRDFMADLVDLTRDLIGAVDEVIENFKKVNATLVQRLPPPNANFAANDENVHPAPNNGAPGNGDAAANIPQQ